MNHRISIFAALIGLLGLAGIAFSQEQVEYPSGELLVKFKAGYELAGQVANLAIGAQVETEITAIKVIKVSLPEGLSVSSAIAYYRSKPYVQFAEPNFIRHWTFTPNDPMFGTQYHHQRIKTPSAWDLTTGSPTVIIAVLDSGVDTTHPDLAGKIFDAWDFVNEDPIPEDNVGHGTHVCGIAAAATNNAIGISGVGFNCKILMGKVGEAGLLLDDILQGITWAADRGAEVINMSFGGYGLSQAEETAVNYAWSKGVVLVAAAGNDNVSTQLYPAAFQNCIAVGSSNQSDTKSGFSNFGNWVDVAAPGSSILSTIVGGGYEAWDGTSMASPVVAGVVGLVWSFVLPTTTNAEVRAAIENNCDNIGTWIVKGRVNAFKALNALPVFVDLPVPASGVSVFQGSFNSGDVSSVQAIDGSFFMVNPVMVTAQGRASGAIIDFQTTENFSTANKLTFKINGQAVLGSTGMIYLWKWSLNKFLLVKSFPMNAGSAGNTITITAAKPFSQWKSGSGQVRVLFRGLTPARNPALYTLQVERAEMVVRKRQ